jgi:hypothetical protein
MPFQTFGGWTVGASARASWRFNGADRWLLRIRSVSRRSNVVQAVVI